MIAWSANEVDAETAGRLVEDEGALLLDVREAYRRERRPVQASLHRPLSLLLADDSGLPRDRPLLVLTDEGEGARFAAAVLDQRGYTAYAVEGGALALDPPDPW
jgi:rhodanese-related sulfurtransferase